jgi:hypothetical protein
MRSARYRATFVGTSTCLERSLTTCLMSAATELHGLAQALVDEDRDFFTAKGAGAGDHATNAFMRALRVRAAAHFGEDHAEQRLCGNNAFAADFYFRREATIVEVALGLKNPSTEFEKDVLKAVMAKELGAPVEHLTFIAKPGGARKCQQPGRSAIRDWVERGHGIRVAVHELAVNTEFHAPPPPRRRRRGESGE